MGRRPGKWMAKALSACFVRREVNPEDRLMIMSDKPPTRRCPFGTNRGSNVPIRSRGVARSKGQPRKAPPKLVEGATVQGWNAAYGALSLAFPGRLEVTL